MIITDLLTLTEFFEQLATSTDGIDHFLPLSNGLKAVDEIESYYTNDYRGCTVFFQVAETPRDYNGAGLDTLTFLCSLTVAEKPDDVGARAGLITRDRTMKRLLQLLGQLEQAMETAQQQDDEFWIKPSERIFPIGLLANVNLDGHYLDIDVTIPANHLLFPA